MAEDSDDDDYEIFGNNDRKNKKIKKTKIENYIKKNFNL